jgi:hypothetical protein
MSETPLENIYANIVMNDELLNKQQTGTIVSQPATSNVSSKKNVPLSNHFHSSVSDITDEEHDQVDDVSEDISLTNYSDDFTSAPTQTSTPRSPRLTDVRTEKEMQ